MSEFCECAFVRVYVCVLASAFWLIAGVIAPCRLHQSCCHSTQTVVGCFFMCVWGVGGLCVVLTWSTTFPTLVATSSCRKRVVVLPKKHFTFWVLIAQNLTFSLCSMGLRHTHTHTWGRLSAWLIRWVVVGSVACVYAWVRLEKLPSRFRHKIRFMMCHVNHQRSSRIHFRFTFIDRWVVSDYVWWGGGSKLLNQFSFWLTCNSLHCCKCYCLFWWWCSK